MNFIFDNDTNDDDHPEGWELNAKGSTLPILRKTFGEEGYTEEAFGKNKMEADQQNKQHQKSKGLLRDNNQSFTESGPFDDDQNSFLKPQFRSVSFSSDGVDNQEESKESGNKKPIFPADEPETPQPRTIEKKPLFEEESSFDFQKSYSEWYVAKLKELGLQVKSSDIRKTIQQLPEGTTKDIIIETLIQKYYDGNFSDEEDVSITPLNPSPNYNSPINPARKLRNQSTFFCYGCSEDKPGEGDDYRISDCIHYECRDCLQKIYNNLPDKKDLSGLLCPYSKICKKPVRLDKLYEILPEAEAGFYGIYEEEIGPCDICFETVRGPKELLQIFDCNEHFYCFSCTKTHIKEHLEKFKVLKLKCPDAGCGASVNDDKMKKIISAEIFEKYSKFKKNALVERNPNLKWCSRPGCEQIIEKPQDKSKAVCQCGQETCFDCGNTYHQGKTCEKASKDLYKFYAKSNDIQICPECKSRVQKAEGCNHMTCLVCTYEWCWLCKGEYSRNHYDPFNPLGCPGLMSGNNTRKKWSKLKLYGYRFLIFLGILLAIATSPIWVIILAILLPNIAWTPNYNRGKCSVCVLRFLLFIIGLAFFPLTLALGAIGAVVPGSCYLIAYIYKFFKTKSENKQRRKRLIRERLERDNDVGNPPVHDLRRSLLDDDIFYEVRQPGYIEEP